MNRSIAANAATLRIGFAAALMACCAVLAPFHAPAADAPAPDKPAPLYLAVSTGKSATVALPDLAEGALYGLTIYIPELRNLAEHDRIKVEVADTSGTFLSKTLHAGDPDLYATIRPRLSGEGRVTVTLASDREASFEVMGELARMKVGPAAKAIIAAAPNGDWKSAQPIELGRTVYGSGDDRPYIPAIGSPDETLSDLFAGAEWFTFTWAGPNPALVHFDVQILDRDVPVDAALFTRNEAAKPGDPELAPYEAGIERYVPEKSTPFHGLYKFITRTVKPGTYYLRVMANHPAFKLRTKVYPAPPYDDPRTAIRTAMDYLVKKGDSWHANTPRRGGVILRTSNPFGETAQCIACHPTQFTTRGELIAVENGWPVRERESLAFLTDRLYNNPRPLYGKPEAAWVRMISAPGNVTSRLEYMLTTFERTISHEERPGLIENIGNYLEMYWKDLNDIYMESNGNLPRVSGFEIAMHGSFVFDELHRRTGERKYYDLARKLEGIIVKGEPQDNIDLCWKAVGLATFDREKYAPQLKELIDLIFQYQRPDGTWAMPYGKEVLEHNYRKRETTKTAAPLDPEGNPVGSEFQTYHCAYALAKAGLPADDPRMVKLVAYILAHQQPSGGWQGNKDYKNFDTPFRDTQYALMALTELYKGPGSDGWMAGFEPAPKTFDLADTGETLDALDQYWEDPGVATRALIRKALGNPQPLVRHHAAAALGRLGDAQAVGDLAAHLGDRSKLVQRAAAWALRQIASRKGVGEDAILAALKSPDDRTRWGAARIFKQHFRYLTGDFAPAEALLAAMKDDPSATVRMEAAQSLWQWWFWEPQDARKERIEREFVSAMDKPEHPWVRRNLIEGFHNMQDDNVGYLYNSWIRQVSTDDERNIVEAGHKAVVKRQATVLEEVFGHGTESQREGVLRSFYTFHLRETGGDEAVTKAIADPPFVKGDWIQGYRKYAAYDPLTMGTGALMGIGNDHEPRTYYADSAPLVAQGLAELLSGASAERTLQGLLALRNSAGVDAGPALSRRMLALIDPKDAGYSDGVRGIVNEILPGRIDTGDADVAHDVAGLVANSGGKTLDVVEGILVNGRNRGLAAQADVDAALKTRFVAAQMLDRDLPSLAAMLVNAEPLQADHEVIEKAFKILTDGPGSVRQPMARAMLNGPRFLLSGPPRERFQAELNVADEELMTALLKVAAKLDYDGLAESSQSLALGIIAEALANESVAVRKLGLDALRGMVKLQSNPSIVAQLRELTGDADQKIKDSAAALVKSIEARGSKMGDHDLAAMLDYNYFAHKVHPLLQDRSLGEACAECHMNHSVLRLNPAPKSGALTEAEVRENYRSALKVVDLGNPEESLILIKPRMPFEGIELPGNYRKTHGGNVRWKDGKESEAYKAILAWIQGAKEEPTVVAGQ